jgi:hypothetical protein
MALTVTMRYLARWATALDPDQTFVQPVDTVGAFP